MSPEPLAQLITQTIEKEISKAGGTMNYRQPLFSFTSANNPLFAYIKTAVEPLHLLPSDLLLGAQSVVSYFLPFAPWIVEANNRDKVKTAHEWAQAYIDTNSLIGKISASLIAQLGEHGVQAAAEPATHNFDPVTLVSRWSHKSVAVVTGLGSFGLHQMVITDSGCAGRFGSLVIDAQLQESVNPPKERCLYFQDKSCAECITRCPMKALSKEEPLKKQLCWKRCLSNARVFEKSLGGIADVCGKCATGPCALQSAV
jgi:epoxyqueuosine reductase